MTGVIASALSNTNLGSRASKDKRFRLELEVFFLRIRIKLFWVKEGLPNPHDIPTIAAIHQHEHREAIHLTEAKTSLRSSHRHAPKNVGVLQNFLGYFLIAQDGIDQVLAMPSCVRMYFNVCMNTPRINTKNSYVRRICISHAAG